METRYTMLSNQRLILELLSRKPQKSMEGNFIMESRNRPVIRVLMFPWLAHGHISPFLELAKKLSKRNFYLYFCSTPVNLGVIKDKLAYDHFPSIQLVELHLPSLPDLPPHHHTTKGLPRHLLGTLLKALDMASSSFSNILTTTKPDLLISDFFQPWAPELALSLGIPTVQYMIVGAICYTTLIPSDPASNIRDYEIDTYRIKDRFLRCFEPSSHIMLVKSFREIEGKYMDTISAQTMKKVVPVGALVQDPSEEDEKQEITEWLNKKEPSSVVFVSFGSEHYLSEKEREELAQGILLSEVEFIWVLRFPEGEKISVKEALSENFLEVVRERGLIVEDWAPQKRILGHPSIGGFVSHCGWGSVIESMKFGVPLIGLPVHSDQKLHCRVAVEVGVCLEIKKDENESFGRKEVARTIKEVMIERSGENLRSKARELSECIIEKGDKEIDESAAELTKLCSMKTNSS